jgi:hypothetical protein
MVWVRMEVSCDDVDTLLFVDCTRITLGDGNKTSFWLSGWLQGKRPKDITPLLFDKTCTGFTLMHLLQFATLWNFVAWTILQPQHEDKVA